MIKWLKRNGVSTENGVIAVSVWGLGYNGNNYQKDHYFCVENSLKFMIKTIRNSVLKFGTHCIYVKISVGGKEVYVGHIKEWKK